MEDTPPPDAKPAPFDAFTDFARKVLSVPKAEIDRREAEYQREREKKPRRGPKPHDKSN